MRILLLSILAFSSIALATEIKGKNESQEVNFEGIDLQFDGIEESIQSKKCTLTCTQGGGSTTTKHEWTCEDDKRCFGICPTGWDGTGLVLSCIR
jgi:hypothetical protein